MCCLVLASLAGGYLWADVFGRGIAGSTFDQAKLDQDFPDGNAVAIFAVAVFAGAMLVGFIAAPQRASRSAERRGVVTWVAACVGGGAAVFGVALLLT